MSSNESKIPVGTLLVGKYRVAREIGRGGMAAVYEAEQLSLGKKVAVKILASELAASTIVIERFFREARAAASVKSPYIVDVYDSGRLDDGRPFIAMELLEGESLYDRMARVRIIDVDTTIRVIVHTARGLVKAHGAGIVHRDLKPENIFLTKGEDGDDVIKILDFGLAKFYAPVNPEEKAAKRLTREGAVFGTPAYMSPEQVKGQGNVDHRADLWALGCMAYECLIGRPVWNMDQGVAMTFAAIATGPIPVPSSARGDLPAALDAWFRKCLERDPERRYQTARELADAFVESWGHRPASSASFPNVNMSSGSGKHPPAVNPAAPGEGEFQLVADTVEATLQHIPMGPGLVRRIGDGAHGKHANGRMVSSDGSLPIPLVRQSMEVPPAADRDTPSPRARTSPLRVVMSATALAGGISAAIFVWLRFLNPQVFTPLVQSTATAPPSAVPSGTGGTGPAAEEPKWAPAIADSQRLFTAGDVGGALKKLTDVSAMGPQAAAIAKVYTEQFRFMTSKEVAGPCKPVAFSRPRASTDRRAERPAIRATPKGILVTWTDDHIQKEHDHVYGVLLNDAGKPLGPVRDLTPEATDAQRPQLTAQSIDSDRTVLLYWDKSGKEAGVRVRFLDADGRIDGKNGGSHMIGAAGRPGDYWPSIERGPKGFFVVWQDDRDKDKEYDLFVRALSNDLDTLSPETRLTDYHAAPKTKLSAPRVRYPSVAVAADTLLVAYRFENDKEKERGIVRLRVPLAELDRQNGLPEMKDPNRESRVFGDAKPVNTDKAPVDAPAVACGTEGCFVVWHHDQGGASVAAIDPNVGKVQWHNKLSEKGGRPSIAVNDGQVAVSYYERGVMKMVFLSRDGVSQPSSLVKVLDGNNPRPSLAPGDKKGEWTVAWQDADVPKGSAEIYAARILCR